MVMRAVAKTRLSAVLPGFAEPIVRETRAIAVAIGRLVQRAGVTARDQREPESFSNIYTLRQLAR